MFIGCRFDLLPFHAGSDRKAATALLANFRQLSGKCEVMIHPIVARLEAEVLAKLTATNTGADAGLRKAPDGWLRGFFG